MAIAIDAFITRVAVHLELRRNGNRILAPLVRTLEPLLDRVSRNPVVCAKVRSEFRKMLRSRKACPPGWREACFAAATRFGSLIR